MGYNPSHIQRWACQPTFDFPASQVMWCVNMDEGHTVCHHIPPAFSRVRQGTRPLWRETTAQICSVTISPLSPIHLPRVRLLWNFKEKAIITPGGNVWYIIFEFCASNFSSRGGLHSVWEVSWLEVGRGGRLSICASRQLEDKIIDESTSLEEQRRSTGSNNKTDLRLTSGKD